MPCAVLMALEGMWHTHARCRTTLKQAWCTTQAAAHAVAVQVVVTGGAGRTGKLVVEKLLARSDKFEARAVVRGDKVRGAEGGGSHARNA